MNILTIVTADVEERRGDELVAAFERLIAAGLPDGLLETRLLGDGQGHWAIHLLWRDQAALDAMRAGPEPPAAPALFRRFSADPDLAIMPILVDSHRQPQLKKRILMTPWRPYRHRSSAESCRVASEQFGTRHAG